MCGVEGSLNPEISVQGFFQSHYTIKLLLGTRSLLAYLRTMTHHFSIQSHIFTKVGQQYKSVSSEKIKFQQNEYEYRAVEC